MSLDHVLRISLEGAVLAALVALTCALVPRLRAGHRAILWWLVGAKLLLGLVPLPALHVAALPAATVAAAPLPVVQGGSEAPWEPAVALPVPAVSATRAAAWAWLIGATLLTLAAVPDWIRVRRWLKAGRVLDDEAAKLAAARAQCAVGLRRTPRLLAVSGLDTPLVTGLFRPTVLLPAESLQHLAPAELEMTLAHELAHVARGDLWLGLVPALARRLFFFHPVAWIAEREYAIAREAACDEAVLARDDADAFAYGRLLLSLTVRRPLAATIPMSPHSMLKRRLDMIDRMMRRVPIGRAGWALVAVAALAVLPVRLVAKESAEPKCLDLGSGKDNAYVVTDGRSHTMCGDMDDTRLADEQRKKGEDVVWFRVDGQDWVVRDARVVAQARGCFHGVSEIGERQAAIGERQAQIGEQQARIGAEQGQIGLEQATRAARQAEVALRQAHEELSNAQREQVEEDAAAAVDHAKQADLERRRAERQIEMDHARSSEDASQRMAELGARMEALGRGQSELGEMQRVFGEKMSREIAEAQRALSELLDRAMRDGTAQRVN